MLKRNSKALAIVMAFVFCLSFLAPSFVAPPAALAESTNTVAQSFSVGQGAAQQLGVIKIVIPSDSLGLAVGSALTVSFPTETRAANELGAVPFTAGAPAAVAGVQISSPAASSAFGAGDLVATPCTNSKFTINVANVSAPANDGVFYIHFDSINTTSFAGDFTVSLIGAPGSVFTTSPALIVGTVKSEAGTQTFAKSIFNVTAAGGPINTITVFENAANAITTTATAAPNLGAIQLKIVTKGYSWDTAAGAGLLYDWGFGFGPGTAGTPPAAGQYGLGVNVDGDILTISNFLDASPVAVAAVGWTPGMFARAGQLHITGLALTVDDSVARVGQDVEVKISGINGTTGITEQTFTVAKYADFEAKLNESTTTELISGKKEQKIGEFFIEELAPGTLLAGRTITFTLPEGFEWDLTNGMFGNSNYEIVNSSSLTFGATPSYPDRVGAANNAGRTMKLTVLTSSATALNGAKIKFKNLEVMASPKAKGDLTIEVSGKAGVEGTVKVATCTPMVTLEADAVDVVLGVQSQKVADVTLKEAKADSLVDSTTIAGQNHIVLQLDEDFTFTKTPKVEVVEGDIVLDQLAITTGGDRDTGGWVRIPIKAGSLKTPAVIKLSDIYVTSNRNAPEGPVKIKTAKSANNAFNDTGAFADDRVADTVIATNKSVPPSENIGATTGEFNIGSNVYKVNSMVKVMDAAPYIKNNRTYVPVRYLGYALGLTDDQIVWDAGSQKATLTKGDTVVELTIGSTTITVNGEAQTMDVAPEMSNNRTMLPARFVAEAFGAKVGWDAVNRAVVIEN